ncbi:MAG: choice-of-anchor D domain-containing protein [Nitrospirae bacterium]|nr:choice-of-anchor D domain-containing protein [Nitrospirota bacterium]
MKRTGFIAMAVAFFLSALALVSPVGAGMFTEYPLPTAASAPYAITSGPDGALWFTEADGNKIGRITTAGVITEYTIPTAASAPSIITAGPDGALWFTEYGGNKIGRITTAGVITEYPVPTVASSPYGITTGPDGALWFTEYGGNKIGRITTAGVITEYTIPTAASGPYDITTGPDGRLWFTESGGNKIGRINATTGVFVEFSLPGNASSPFGITTGPDGKLWFTEYAGNKIGRLDPTNVAINEFAVPTAASIPTAITTGPDGDLWFTEGIGKIGRITTAGVIAEAAIPTAGGMPLGITTGPDGDLWFTDNTGNKISHFTPNGTFTVTNLNDSGPGSLRQAMLDADASLGADTIRFSVSGTITLASTLPGITDIDGLTIDGTGQTVTISGNNAVQVTGVSTGKSLTLNHLTISNGKGLGSINNNKGTLTIANCTFSDNIGNVGAIYNQSGTTIITNSTFSGNSVTSYAGCIYNSSGTISITNSTFSGNSAPGGACLFNDLGGGTVTLRNSIVADSISGVNCSGAIVSGGYNIDSGNSCGFTGTGDLINTDPLLGPLADNGGPTWTMELLAGSPAIDAGDPATGLNADQRSVPRPFGSADIGAYEYIAKPNQAALIFTPGAFLTYNATETLSTTGGSGTGAVTYQVTLGNCSISGGNVLKADSGTGSCSITATKAGDANYSQATATATVTLQKAVTTTALNANVAFTQPVPTVTLTATVSSPSGSPSSGVVGFTANGSIIAGCAAVSVVSGTATCTTTSLLPGVYDITAVYSVSANYLNSTSAVLKVTTLLGKMSRNSWYLSPEGWIVRAYTKADAPNEVYLEVLDTGNVVVAPSGMAGMSSNPMLLASDATVPEVALGFNRATRTAYVTYTSAGGRQEVEVTGIKGNSPLIGVTPEPVLFGNVKLKKTVTMTVTVSNRGVQPLHVTAIGAPAAPFGIAGGGTCAVGVPVAAGGSCSIVVKFAPAAAQGYSSSFVISSDGGNATVHLSGTGWL